MLSTPPASFRAHYQALVASGAIEPDAAQAEAAEAFAGLEQRLASYKPLRKQSLLGRLFADKDEPPPQDEREKAHPSLTLKSGKTAKPSRCA
jgi:cell division protein ZapE